MSYNVGLELGCDNCIVQLKKTQILLLATDVGGCDSNDTCGGDIKSNLS